MLILYRYQNRKIYCATKKKYVNLSDLRDLVQAGIDFKILDYRTQKEITARVLAKVLLEKSIQENDRYSIETLRKAIQGGFKRNDLGRGNPCH
jgi:polyhydroxyalkanoate synthesis regulator protein